MEKALEAVDYEKAARGAEGKREAFKRGETRN